MTNSYTTTSSVSYVQTAYDRMAYPALRPELYFDQVATVKPSRQSMPGLTVTFQIQNDLAVASTALNESNDLSSIPALSDSTISVVLAEYGNAVLTTAKLRGGSFVDIDPIVANVIGYNAGVSVDSVARAAIELGTNINYSAGASGSTPGSEGAIVATDTIRAYDVRVAQATLRTLNVPSLAGGFYGCFIHPMVSFDLQSETGSGSWRQPHEYCAPEEIWRGELGAFQSFRFIETPRAPEFPSGGSGSIAVFDTLFVGAQALAKAWSVVDGNSPDPHIVPGPVTDYLRRFVPLGWYHLVGYSVFRQQSLLQQYSASSITSLVTVPTIDQ